MSSTRKAKLRPLSVREAAPVSISPQACRRSPVQALAKRAEELRAQKIKDIKARIEQGTYHVDAAEVAQSIVRTEIAWLLNGERPSPAKKKNSCKKKNSSR
jgi:flagellar biosynthesis anti-sigma factor FlgM